MHFLNLLLSLFFLFSLSSSQLANFKTNLKWKHFSENFKLKFENGYAEAKAFNNFLRTDKFIEEHNKMKDKTFELAHNIFSTWDDKQIQAHKGLKKEPKVLNSINNRRIFKSNNHTYYPYAYTTGYLLKTEVDWVKRGWNTPIRNQLNCGSCWAFATAATVEAAYWVKNKTSVVLSPQQLVDCSTKYRNEGCDGGLVNWALDYVWDNGLVEDKNYAYTASDDACKLSAQKNPLYKINQYYSVNGDDNALMEVLDKYGPVAVAIDASSRYFNNYRTGIYATSFGVCTRYTDHAVLLTGYGVTNNGQKYWTIKNQWGKLWGNNGYMNISRDIPNNCGISGEVFFTIIQ